MEVLLEDIRTNSMLKYIRELRTTIIDVAKNVKSNDDTFKISCLPRVSEQLSDAMSKYVDTTQEFEASQRAFNTVYAQVGEDETDREDDVDLAQFLELFKDEVEQEKNNSTTSEIEAQVELEKIIRPFVDEDIQVDPASRQIPKDPITRTDIRIAVRSKVCGHVYDSESIDEYFTQREKAKKRVQCPQAGCTNRNMKRQDIETDEETNKLIQAL